MADDSIIIEHPNREKGASKATKAIVVLLLLVSAVLLLVITIGGWDAEAGGQSISLAWALIYLVLAYFVWRWNRGVLPVVAALAVIMLIFCAVAAPGWFDRDASGYTDPAIASGVLGVLTIIAIPVQALLAIFAMRGFQQSWNVEVERYADGTTNAEPLPA
jgi:peptidoglycan/LPS O-acetylase OafA/YrhL